jgi:hypothetical protein
MEDADDDRSTARCDRCEMPIPTDADRCPVCDYRPAGRNPLAMRVGEYFFETALVVSVLVFVGGVTGITPGFPAETVARMAIVTPYTAGISAFFSYYLHRKRRTTPTDDDVFD